MIEKSNWQEEDQLVRVGLELATSGFQVLRPNHSITLPPLSVHLLDV